MKGITDLSGLRTETDIKLAKANLRNSALLHERIIYDSFSNAGELFVNTVKIVVIQAGTAILTTLLARLLQLDSD